MFSFPLYNKEKVLLLFKTYHGLEIVKNRKRIFQITAGVISGNLSFLMPSLGIIYSISPMPTLHGIHIPSNASPSVGTLRVAL
jgi:hypothetical protein